MARSFLDAVLAAPPAAHPHLSPFNSSALDREHATAIRSLEGLMAYRQFLADARAVKASRKQVSKSFERNVHKQSRQALADMNTFMNNALSMTQHVNQTALWDSVLARSGAALKQSGGHTAQDLWRDLRAHPEAMSALEEFGLTEAMVSLSDDLIARADVSLTVNRGHVEFSGSTGATHPRPKVRIQSRRGRPANVAELFGRPSFDQISAAFARDDVLYFSSPSPGKTVECEPGELLALGAFASRQILVDHVRKLEDTGLATYAGEDPATLTLIIVVGTLIAITGYFIRSFCDVDPDNIQTPPLSHFVCNLADFLIVLGLMMIFLGVSIAVIPITTFVFGDFFGAWYALFMGGIAAGGLDWALQGGYGFEISGPEET